MHVGPGEVVIRTRESLGDPQRASRVGATQRGTNEGTQAGSRARGGGETA